MLIRWIVRSGDGFVEVSLLIGGKGVFGLIGILLVCCEFDVFLFVMGCISRVFFWLRVNVVVEGFNYYGFYGLIILFSFLEVIVLWKSFFFLVFKLL